MRTNIYTRALCPKCTKDTLSLTCLTLTNGNMVIVAECDECRFSESAPDRVMMYRKLADAHGATARYYHRVAERHERAQTDYREVI